MVHKSPEYMPLTRAVELVSGRRFHPSTVCRWHRQGVGGIRLESRTIGGRPMATLEMVERFFDRTTAAADASVGE